jgi:hypothetical protein
LWAKNRREVDRFHEAFLLPNNVPVTEEPMEYSIYTPGYYAVFFDDPINGIHWELAHFPFLFSPGAYLRWRRAIKAEAAKHPEWGPSPIKTALRKLPGRK